MKFPWQQLKINFRVEKTARNVSRSKLMKNLFRKKKVTILFFHRFEWSFFWTFSGKLLAWLSKMQPAYLSKILSFNSFFEKLHTVSTFFWVWDKRSSAFSRKVFFRVFITWYRAFRGISWGKQISLSKKFFSFRCHFSRLSNFFVVLQFFQADVSKQRFTFVEKRNCEN